MRPSDSTATHPRRNSSGTLPRYRSSSGTSRAMRRRVGVLRVNSDAAGVPAGVVAGAVGGAGAGGASGKTEDALGPIGNGNIVVGGIPRFLDNNVGQSALLQCQREFACRPGPVDIQPGLRMRTRPSAPQRRAVGVVQAIESPTFS